MLYRCSFVVDGRHVVALLFIGACWRKSNITNFNRTTQNQNAHFIFSTMSFSNETPPLSPYESSGCYGYTVSPVDSPLTPPRSTWAPKVPTTPVKPVRTNFFRYSDSHQNFFAQQRAQKASRRAARALQDEEKASKYELTDDELSDKFTMLKLEPGSPGSPPLSPVGDTETYVLRHPDDDDYDDDEDEAAQEDESEEESDDEPTRAYPLRRTQTRRLRSFSDDARNDGMIQRSRGFFDLSSEYPKEPLTPLTP